MNNMKRIFLILVFVTVASFDADAIDIARDTTKKAPVLDYQDELGFFQKANRELSDPRFMFKDDKTGIEFGIGGTAQVAAGFTFGGSLSDYDFKPAAITVPTDVVNSFGIKVSGTEIHLKSRAMVKKHKVLAFIKIGANADNKISLKQAYVSFDGFSIGMIPSFFNDMEFGVMSQGSVNMQVDATQPLVGYTYKSPKGWEFAAAVEKADFELTPYLFKDLATDFQSMPDMTFHIKKRWADKGHIQFGGVARKLNYWARNELEAERGQGDSRSEFAYGFSLSGNYKPFKNLKFSATVVGGTGIEKYMGVFKGLNLDVCTDYAVIDNHYKIKTVPAISAGFAAQYNWNEDLSTAVLGSYGRCFTDMNNVYYKYQKDAFQVQANTYWMFDEYGYMGLAYFFGQNTLTPPDINQKQVSGVANRLMFIIAYMF